MMGTLGPGQTTNIALSSEDGEANRIFAVAVPKFGFDPASIDFASFTSLIYDEYVKMSDGSLKTQNQAECANS